MAVTAPCRPKYFACKFSRAGKSAQPVMAAVASSRIECKDASSWLIVGVHRSGTGTLRQVQRYGRALALLDADPRLKTPFDEVERYHDVEWPRFSVHPCLAAFEPSWRFHSFLAPQPISVRKEAQSEGS